MALLGALRRGLLRGADRLAPFTSKRGPRSHNKGRGARRPGALTSNRKFLLLRPMVPHFVVPDLAACELKAYVSFRAAAGAEPPLTARRLFDEAVAPRLERDVRDGVFREGDLQRYGFEETQEGKLFRLFPKNYVR